ncbi:unnamed protein product [Agarophyton chilense]
MPFSTKQSQSCKWYGFHIVILLLILNANGSDAEKTTQAGPPSKTGVEMCPKVLPIFSGELQSKSRRGPDRIVNGDRAPHMKLYMAALVSEGFGFFCSASLLSKYWAVTAAHCEIDPRRVFLRVGGSSILDGIDFEIEKAIPHPRYLRNDRGTEENDVQLIKLKKPVPRHLKFFYINRDPSYPATSSFARTCGYGDTYGTSTPNSGVLREVDVPIQVASLCQDQYEDLNVNIEDTAHICAGYERGGCDSCYGDSGGPLFTVGKNLVLVQVGIVSFGYECAAPLRPGVYTRISSYISWMSESGAVFETTSDGINIFGHNEPPTKTPADEPEKSYHEEPESNAENEVEHESDFIPPSAEINSAFGVVDSNLTIEPRSACFPANAVVALENGGDRLMMDLQVGDRVRVGPQEFSEVFMFTHKRRTGVFKFVRIECRMCKKPLLLSLDHVLSINGVLRPAHEVRVGDSIVKASRQLAEVTHVSHVREKGLYNPQTMDGRIIVNDILVTTYTTAIDKQTAHALLTPLRFCFRNFNWLLNSRALN